MHRIGPGMPAELQPINDKAQAGIDAVTAIIALLIEESVNPEDTKKKLATLLNKYGTSKTLGNFGVRLNNLLK